MSNQSTAKIPAVHFDNLDALRFFAAMAVFVFHYFRDVNGLYANLTDSKLFKTVLIVTDKGSLGVNFFFVLSGFLITYLILQEDRRKGFFNYGKFLVRRTLRIWPLYFIIVFIGFVLFPLLFQDYHTSHDPVNYLFFLANFDEIRNGVNDSINFLTSPWSIAVEEQFYLFWGLALLLILKQKKFKIEWLIGLLYLGTFLFRWWHKDDPHVLYYHTLSVCQDLLTGCFVAISLFKKRQWLDRLQNINRTITVVIYLLGAMICIGKNKLFFGDLQIVERLVLSLYFSFIILDQIRGKHSFYKFGTIKWFNYLGKVSYGIYMYHLVVMYLIDLWFNTIQWTGYWQAISYFVAALTGTLLIAILSYQLVESRLLKLKPH